MLLAIHRDAAESAGGLVANLFSKHVISMRPQWSSCDS